MKAVLSCIISSHSQTLPLFWVIRKCSITVTFIKCMQRVIQLMKSYNTGACMSLSEHLNRKSLVLESISRFVLHTQFGHRRFEHVHAPANYTFDRWIFEKYYLLKFNIYSSKTVRLQQILHLQSCLHQKFF